MEGKLHPLRQLRENLMLGKTELARKANISTTTLWRVENGFPCRSTTLKKILKALGIGFDKEIALFKE